MKGLIYLTQITQQEVKPLLGCLICDSQICTTLKDWTAVDTIHIVVQHRI